MPKISAIILAAGKGKRMKSDLPKVLHQVAGDPLIAHSLRAIQKLKISKTILVVSKKKDKIKNTLTSYPFKGISFAIQDPPLGTGHAVMTALKRNPNLKGHVLIHHGDVPFVSEETFRNLVSIHLKKKAKLTFLTTLLDQPGSYGRVTRKNRTPSGIVEFKDATPAERKIREINVGTYVVETSFLRKSLKSLSRKNVQKEYYLTDLVGQAFNSGQTTATFQTVNQNEALGVNNKEELCHMQKLIYQKRVQKLINKGVHFIGTDNVIIDSNASAGAGTTIFGPCYLLGKTKVGKNCILEPGTVLKNTQIKNKVIIKAYSYLEEAKVESGAQIGPFAHIRPKSIIGPDAKVGNFVEVKKSKIGKGSKANHLSYIGDATIGKKVNVGAGTITCNYDGYAKYPTILADGVFVGSDTQFVAPVKVGREAVIGAGSTITKDVKPYSLALSRAPQTSVKDWAKRRKKK